MVIVSLVVISGATFLFLRRRLATTGLTEFLNCLREDELHAVVRLTDNEFEQWNAQAKSTRLLFRETTASEAVQSAVDSGGKSLVLVAPDDTVLLVAHVTEDDEWGFLELPGSSKMLLNELVPVDS
mgnify:CR=1 FL=1